MPVTRNERLMLDALNCAPRGAATADELIARHPAIYGGRPARSVTASIHLTGASLVRKGLVKRGRRDSGPRLYRITEAGRAIP